MTGAIGAHLTPSEYEYELGGQVAMLGQKWIPRDRKCVASARRFVRDIAADWNAVNDVPDIAELLTSEVVTNALIHGMPHPPVSSAIRITVVREGRFMTVDVYDSCVAVPQLRAAASMETSGRGLTIVETLAGEWGWNLHRHGKSVWFQLTAWP
ncbi:ATP-binding protein [Sphaerisporangium corydalis]|uniref:ATP-binding protein n=1 Tax=Sphaerisporangium corydalis TaxID=1441875 RepID=A0ABV9ELM3_9ACTN|nr:ATP-binding protein [Sphaerisporangium corydalis]